MISVTKALEKVRLHCKELRSITVDIEHSLGEVTSSDVFSPINMPPFPQSAMDGYAVSYNDSIHNYRVVGEIAAGDSGEEFNLTEGTAVRIFTGAIVPKGANVVVKQEIVEQEKDLISFSEPVSPGENIRPEGEQIKKGDLALPKGHRLNPASIGFLAGLGIDQIQVISRPKITIIVTGNELISPGSPLPLGRIYESNSIMLASALDQYGYTEHKIVSIGDDYVTTKTAIQEAIDQSDVLILSGGISVGDYDFVGKALNEIGVDQIFYKVKQKPGKPLFFGTLDQKVIFALPGNPAAAMTSFYIYVLLALNILSGEPSPGLELEHLPLYLPYTKKGNRAEFLKANISNGQVTILEGQSSAMLKSFAVSNGLVYVSSETNELEQGTLVPTYIL